MTPPVIDQEFIVHLFAPLDGPQADQAYRQVQQVWAACRAQLEMTKQIDGLAALGVPPPARAALPAGGTIATQENANGDRQGILRRVHDVLNLSVALAQPAPEGLRPRQRPSRFPFFRPSRLPERGRLGWKDLAQVWAHATGPGTEAMLGEARLFLARAPRGATGAVAATASLGQSLDLLLPVHPGRPRDWWRRGITTAAGHAVWDTRLAADTGSVREIVIVAAADQDAKLSEWAWSDGRPEIPSFARYLLQAARLRYEARLLTDWHREPRADEPDEVVAGLRAMLTRDPPDASHAGALRDWLRHLRAEEERLADLEAKLSHLQQTISSTHENLRELAGPDASGMFAADDDMARWLAGQVEYDLSNVTIDLRRASRARSLAAEELDQLPAAGPGTPAEGKTPASGISQKVFIVHGRDEALVKAFREQLRAARLEPLEWQALVAATGSTAPYLGQVVAAAPHLAQATLVLLSPDDIVELHSDHFYDNDLPHERARSMQARPNVLFELGLALMAYPERTVVVEIGTMRPVTDLAGLNAIHFNGSVAAVQAVLARLAQAGCPVDYSAADLFDQARFAGLAAYRRDPGSHSAGRDPGAGQ